MATDKKPTKRVAVDGPESWNNQLNKIEGNKQKAEMLRILSEEENRSKVLPKGMLRAIAMGESNLHPHAESSAGAKGPLQFMKDTARRFGLIQGTGADEKDYRTDPKRAAAAARKYLEQLYTQFDGDFDKTVAAYNAGEGNIGKIKKGWAEGETPDYFFRETQQYVPKIRHYYKHFANDPEGKTLPKEREWLVWGAPLPTRKRGTQTAENTRGRGLSRTPAPSLYTGSNGKQTIVPPRTYATNGPSRMPRQDEVAFQQPERSDLQRGLQSYREREAAGPATELYAEPQAVPNSYLGSPSDVQMAMRDFAYADQPTPERQQVEPAPVRGLAARPQATPERSAMTAASETYKPASSEYYKGDAPYTPVAAPRMYNGRMVEQPAPVREDIYAGIEGGIEGNPSWPGSGRLPAPVPRMYSGRMVEQPAPREDIYAGIEGGMEGNPSWPGSGPLPVMAERSPTGNGPYRFRASEAPMEPQRSDLQAGLSRVEVAPPSRVSMTYPAPPREDIYAGIQGGIEGNPSWPGSGRVASRPPARASARAAAPVRRAQTRPVAKPREDWYPKVFPNGQQVAPAPAPVQAPVSASAPVAEERPYVSAPYNIDWEDQLHSYYMDQYGIPYEPYKAGPRQMPQWLDQQPRARDVTPPEYEGEPVTQDSRASALSTVNWVEGKKMPVWGGN